MALLLPFADKARTEGGFSAVTRTRRHIRWRNNLFAAAPPIESRAIKSGHIQTHHHRQEPPHQFLSSHQPSRIFWYLIQSDQSQASHPHHVPSITPRPRRRRDLGHLHAGTRPNTHGQRRRLHRPHTTAPRHSRKEAHRSLQLHPLDNIPKRLLPPQPRLLASVSPTQHSTPGQ